MKKLLLAVVLCLFVIPVGADESSKQIPLTSGSVYDAIRETDFDVNICLESNDYYQNELVLDKMISSTSETVIKQTFFTICRAINAIMEDRTNDGFGYTLITEEGFILISARDFEDNYSFTTSITTLAHDVANGAEVNPLWNEYYEKIFQAHDMYSKFEKNRQDIFRQAGGDPESLNYKNGQLWALTSFGPFATVIESDTLLTVRCFTDDLFERGISTAKKIQDANWLLLSIAWDDYSSMPYSNIRVEYYDTKTRNLLFRQIASRSSGGLWQIERVEGDTSSEFVNGYNSSIK